MKGAILRKRDPLKQKEYSARKALNLTDAYIANLLRLPVSDARGCPDLIEIKRATIFTAKSDQGKESSIISFTEIGGIRQAGILAGFSVINFRFAYRRREEDGNDI